MQTETSVEPFIKKCDTSLLQSEAIKVQETADATDITIDINQVFGTYDYENILQPTTLSYVATAAAAMPTLNENSSFAELVHFMNMSHKFIGM